MAKILRRTDPTKDLVYVIGDCRGRTDLLLKMFNKINAEPVAANDKIAIMGSVVSEYTKDMKATFNAIRGFMGRYENQVTYIRGANEQRLLMNKKTILQSPLGVACLDSYRTGSVVYNTANVRTPKYELKSMVEDMLWLQNTSKKFLMTNSLFVCSSGVAPTKSLEDQIQNALMFMRYSFEDSNRVYEKIIVHGNSKRNKPRIKDTRIDVSSSPLETGILSCVVIDDRTGKVQEIFTVEGDVPKVSQKQTFNNKSKDTAVAS